MDVLALLAPIYTSSDWLTLLLTNVLGFFAHGSMEGSSFGSMVLGSL